ncbi:formate dehydrogenase subunit delta [Bordetella sp. 2513F-2]
MDIGNLIRMANRIGEFFEAMPDRTEAADGVADHIRKFWEPRMRRALLDFLAAHPDGQAAGASLHPLVRDAVAAQRERLAPMERAG